MNTYKCKSCTLTIDERNGPIRPLENNFAEVMIVLDYPDRDDNFNNKICSGEAGKKLAYFLDKIGLNLKDCYITYAVECMPQAERHINKRVIEAVRPQLAYEIYTLKPKVVIAMGKFANWALTQNESLVEFRGHFHYDKIEVDIDKNTKDIFDFVVMPTFSPHKSMGKWEYHQYIIHDLKKAYDHFVIGRGHKKTVVPEYLAIRSKRDLKEFYETMMEDTKWATTDLETTGFDFFRNKIINAGYCTDKNKIFVVPLLPYNNKTKIDLFNKWTEEEIEVAKEINSFLKDNRRLVYQTLKRVNANKNIKYIFHNGKFDLNFARYAGIPYHDIHIDTILASSLVDENRMHSLNIVAELYGYDFGPYDTGLWHYTNKGEKSKKSFQYVPASMLEKYLAIDVFATKCILKNLVKDLKKENLFDYFMSQKMEALKLVTDTEYDGVKFDREKILEVDEDLTGKTYALLDEIRNFTGKSDFNPNSDAQVLSHMIENNYPFGKFNIRKTKSGKYSVEAETLKKFAKVEKFSRLPKLILTFKALTKLTGTYVAGSYKRDEGEVGGFLKYMDKNDRIHTGFNMHTPRTGRYSSRSPSLMVFPRPMKGIPNIRQFLVPTSKDHVFFEADYVSLEVNVIAALSKDIELTSELQNGDDMHCKNGVMLGHTLGTVPEEVTYEAMLVANDKHHGKLTKEEIEVAKRIIQDFNHINFHEKRTQAKNVQFGLNYGKSTHTFAEEFGILETESEDMVDGYFRKYYGMKKFRDEYVSNALNIGFGTLLKGRKRRVSQATDWIFSEFGRRTYNAKRIQGDVERQLLNYPVQGNAHDIFEVAIIKLNKEFKKRNLSSRLRLLIHDGIVGECLRQELPETLKIVKEVMPFVYHKGTKFELRLDVDVDAYEYEWYGEKLKT